MESLKRCVWNTSIDQRTKPRGYFLDATQCCIHCQIVKKKEKCACLSYCSNQSLLNHWHKSLTCNLCSGWQLAMQTKHKNPYWSNVGPQRRYAVSPTQHRSHRDKVQKTKRKNKKKKVTWYKVTPFFFPQHPHKASSFWQECSQQKIKLQDFFKWEKGSSLRQLIDNTVPCFKRPKGMALIFQNIL